MQRDSKQRPKPSPKHSPGVTAIHPPHPTTGTPASAASRSGPTTAARKRRPSRIALQDVQPSGDAAVESPVLKPGKRAKNAVAPAASSPTHHQRQRVSALAAAAQVLRALTGDEAKLGVTAQTLIERMAKQKLWTSPGGKTPQATLYAAMVREITAKGSSARFRKVSKGHFAAAASGDRASKPPARPAAAASRKRVIP